MEPKIQPRDIICLPQGKGMATYEVGGKWQIRPVAKDLDLGNGAGEAVYLSDQEAAKFQILKSVPLDKTYTKEEVVRFAEQLGSLYKFDMYSKRWTMGGNMAPAMLRETTEQLMYRLIDSEFAPKEKPPEVNPEAS